jgi:sodium transport system permease protein
MSLEAIPAVLRKELVDSFRDRRALASSLAYAFFGPLVVTVVLGALAASQTSKGRLQVPFSGAERAPNLVAYLEQQGAEVVPAPADAEQAIRRGEVDFVIEVDSDYREDYLAMRPAEVRVLFDSARLSGQGQRQEVARWIQAWSIEVAQLRLLARGVDPAIARPIVLESRDFASQQARGARVLGSLPMFLLLAAFVCGMSVAIDTTAGERERGSLESLLAHGVSTRSLAIGKWITVVVFDLLGLVLTLLFSVFLLRPERFAGLGVAVRFEAAEAAGVLAVMLPMVFLAPALQMAVAIFSRNFKEAQTYLSLMLFVPMVPGFLLIAELLEVKPWMHWVPVLAQQIQILAIVRGDGVTSSQFFSAALVTLAAAALLVELVGSLLGRERIVLAR